MTLDIDCDDCGDPLEEKGALLFSPPVNRETTKTHLCVDCYDDLIEEIYSDNNETDIDE